MLVALDAEQGDESSRQPEGGERWHRWFDIGDRTGHREREDDHGQQGRLAQTPRAVGQEQKERPMHGLVGCASDGDTE